MQQKVLLYTEKGSNDSNIELFCHDFYYRDFEPIAIVASKSESDEILELEQIPRQFLIQFPIVLLEVSNFEQTIELFVQRGIPRKNMIIWNSKGINCPIQSEENGETVVRLDGFELHCRDEEDLENLKWTIEYIRASKVRYRVPPEIYEKEIARWFNKATGRSMDWENPRTLQEKIQWLKLYDSTPLKTLGADKFKVREYVARKIGIEYLIPLLDVWNDPEEIDIDNLPNQFVLKCNHGSGMNVVVNDKSSFDFEHAKEKIRAWMLVDYGVFAFEFHYSRIPKKIIAEQYMEFLGDEGIADYKFHCFDGEPIWIQYETHDPIWKITCFNMNWEREPFNQIGYPEHTREIPPPKNLALMIELAKKLSEGFSFIRVDFYEFEGKVYFGELTFTTFGGILRYDPPEWNLKLGEYLKLPPKGKPFNRFE